MEKIMKIIESAVPFKEKVDCMYPCYKIDKHKYILFYNGETSRDNQAEVADKIGELMFGKEGRQMSLVIVVSSTRDAFHVKELVGMSGDSLISFVLYNKDKKEICANTNWVFILGLNYKEYTKAILEAFKNNPDWADQNS